MMEKFITLTLNIRNRKSSLVNKNCRYPLLTELVHEMFPALGDLL